MSSSSQDKRRAGVFLLVSGALTVIFCGLTLGWQSLTTEHVRYRVVFEDSVGGLEASSPVRYHGVPIGEIAEIDFLDSRAAKIEVTISVEPRAPINTETKAQLHMRGITGVYHLELFGGGPAARLLEPGAEIPTAPSLVSELSGIAQDVGDVVTKLDELLSENRAALEDLVSESAALAREGRVALRGLRADVAAVASRTVEASRAVASAAEGVEQAAAEAELGELSQQAQSSLARVETLLRELERTQAHLATVAAAGADELPGTLRDLRQTAADARAAVHALRRDPSRLVRGTDHEPAEFPDPLPPRPGDPE